jgi:transposase-like protein
MNKAAKRQIIRRNEKEKLELISQWEKSGLSIKRFCHEHQFSDSLFHSWLNKYRRHNKKAPVPHNDFMALPITAPAAMPPDNCSLYAEVILKDGVRIKLYQPVSVDYLRTLTA